MLLQLSTHAQADKRGQQVALEVKRVRQRIQEQEAIAEALREEGTLIEVTCPYSPASTVTMSSDGHHPKVGQPCTCPFLARALMHMPCCALALLHRTSKE